ncbi:hypothetical protein [Caldimonas sp. KR1-144]|uniref:hypothetical protein n=1 Tax=Caldimonas sp. KR1-144 TaxID=3400911 RepID=UPI003BFEA643
MVADAAPAEIPAWFNDAIVNGIQRLYVLGLAGTPAAETVVLTGNVWVELLWNARRWDEPSTPTRLAEAFRRLSFAADRWPAPAQLLEYVPDRAQPKVIARSYTQEQIANNLAFIRKERERLFGPKRRPCVDVDADEGPQQ